MPAVWMALLLLPLVTLLTVYQSYLRGLRRAIMSQIPVEIVRPILLLVGVFLANLFAPNLLDGAGLVLIQIVTAVITLLLLWTLANKHTPLRSAGSELGMQWGPWLRAGIPLVGIALVNKGNAQIVSLILGSMSDTSAVAYFNIAKRLSDLTTFMQVAIVLPLAPAIAKAFESGKTKELHKLAVAAAWGGALFAVPVLLVLLTFAGPLLSLFGAAYMQATTELRILALAQAATVLLGPVAVWLTMSKREGIALFTASAGLGVLIILAFWLIPAYGSVGAALAYAGGLLTTQLLMLSQIWRLHRIDPTIFGLFHGMHTGDGGKER
jgi:O-antigen/teichoic acid export membrane protein